MDGGEVSESYHWTPQMILGEDGRAQALDLDCLGLNLVCVTLGTLGFLTCKMGEIAVLSF